VVEECGEQVARRVKESSRQLIERLQLEAAESKAKLSEQQERRKMKFTATSNSLHSATQQRRNPKLPPLVKTTSLDPPSQSKVQVTKPFNQQLKRGSASTNVRM
jgi:hypothetical protein